MTQVLFNKLTVQWGGWKLASYKLMMIVWASTLPPFLPPPKVARSPPITAQKSTFDFDANCAQISSSRERLDRIHWLWEDIFQIAFAPQPQSLSPPTPHLCSYPCHIWQPACLKVCWASHRQKGINKAAESGFSASCCNFGIWKQFGNPHLPINDCPS